MSAPVYTTKLLPDGGQSKDFITLKVFKTVDDLNAALPKDAQMGTQWMEDEGLVDKFEGCEACFIQPADKPEPNKESCVGELFLAVGADLGVIVHECTHAGLLYGGLVNEWNREKGAFGDPVDECKSYEHWHEACAHIVQYLFEQVVEALKLVKA